MSKASKDKPAVDTSTDALAVFETAMTELEGLVNELESGDVSLEVSLKKFERGVALSRQCQKALKTAELRVEQLMQDADGNEVLAEFKAADDNDGQP